MTIADEINTTTMVGEVGSITPQIDHLQTSMVNKVESTPTTQSRNISHRVSTLHQFQCTVGVVRRRLRHSHMAAFRQVLDQIMVTTMVANEGIKASEISTIISVDSKISIVAVAIIIRVTTGTDSIMITSKVNMVVNTRMALAPAVTDTIKDNPEEDTERAMIVDEDEKT